MPSSMHSYTPHTLPPLCFSQPAFSVFQHQPGTIRLAHSRSQAHPFPPKYCLKRRICEHHIHLYMASRALPQAISNDWSNKLMHIATAPSSSFAPCFVSTVQWIPPTERIAQSMALHHHAQHFCIEYPEANFANSHHTPATSTTLATLTTLVTRPPTRFANSRHTPATLATL